jgi:hypothetical protein
VAEVKVFYRTPVVLAGKLNLLAVFLLRVKRFFSAVSQLHEYVVDG